MYIGVSPVAVFAGLSAMGAFITVVSAVLVLLAYRTVTRNHRRGEYRLLVSNGWSIHTSVVGSTSCENRELINATESPMNSRTNCT